MTIGEWAETYRYVSPETSARPGPWRSDPHHRPVLEALADPETEEVVLMTSSQVGKTELLMNVLGFYSHWDPSPVLIVQPTIEMAEAFSKERLAPMIRDTRALTDLFPDPKSRSSGNTIRYKEFPGGFVALVGANAPAGLAMRPIRVVLCDEIDRWPPSAGTEGDPLMLAVKRQTTYWNRKRVLVSTPTIKGASRIDAAYRATDQCRLHVPCPHCGHAAPLTWSMVHWDAGPADARLQCESCLAPWGEGERLRALEDLVAIPQAPERGRTRRGFWFNELYSPSASVPGMVAAFLEAKKWPETLQTFINTSLAELWEGEGETVEAATLYHQRRVRLDALPEAVEIITAGVDVLDDRLEVEVVGWDADRRSWSLGYEVLGGDPRILVGQPRSPWNDLDELLARELGRGLKVSSALVDAGHLPDEVMAFTRPRAARGIYASRGESGPGKPWIIAASRKNTARARVYRLGVDTLKGHLYRYLTIDPELPGGCLWPDTYELAYFEQLTSERLITRYRQGFRTLIWELPSGARNEALDCRVYAMAALERVRPRRSDLLRRAATPRPHQPQNPQNEFRDPRWTGFGGDYWSGR